MSIYMNGLKEHVLFENLKTWNKDKEDSSNKLYNVQAFPSTLHEMNNIYIVFFNFATFLIILIFVGSFEARITKLANKCWTFLISHVNRFNRIITSGTSWPDDSPTDNSPKMVPQMLGQVNLG